MDVEDDNGGLGACDLRDRGIGILCLADDLELVAELGAQATAEELVVVDQEHADAVCGHSHPATLGTRICTSVPSPGAVVKVAVPPSRRMRPTMNSLMPRRSGGTLSRSKPRPLSRT